MTLTAQENVDVCNITLTMIGAATINTFEEPSNDLESHCAILFPVVLKALLAKNPWNFANVVVQLAAVPDATKQYGYKYAYRLPANLVAGPFAVYDSVDTKYPVHNYRHASDYVYTDEDVVYVLYRIKPSVEIWPAYFLNLFVTALGAKLAKPVADNTALGVELNKEAFGTDGNGGLFAEAKRLDAITNVNRNLFQNGDPLTATRF